MTNEPFTQAAWLAANLATARARLQFAVDRKGEAVAWPAELLQVEANIGALAAETGATGHPMPMLWLRSRLGLSATEERVLWILIAHELCSVSRSQLRALNTESLPDPTTEALRQAVYLPFSLAAGWCELAPDGALRRLGLIERTDVEARAPEHRQTWRIASRVVALAHGDERIDAELAGLGAIAPEIVPGIRGRGLEAPAGVVSAIDGALGAALMKCAGVILVQGRSGTGRRSLLLAAAQARGLRIVELNAEVLAKDPDQARRQLRMLSRECRLLELHPLVRNLDVLSGTAESPDRIGLVEQELAAHVVLATSSRGVARRWQRAPRTIELTAITGAQRTQLWARALPMATPEDATTLATMYPLAPALIEAASLVAIEQAGPGHMTPEHIMAGLRAVLDDRLAGLATRVTTSQTWDDLVLPVEQEAAVGELLARIRERRVVYEEWGFGNKVGRGLGVSALFSGPPGTGKTMAAGLVARDLGTELYQVDLSKIVSKWIGETEKNLAALFDAAEAGHAILLFDEADTLFGKRTDVKSSNDRHANQETNYLLQRLETFTGVCILTTNHDAAIDEAFRRRLSAHVQFPMPEVEERAKLWETLLPKAAPVHGPLDFDRLARTYEMSGGYIRNAVLRAAFLAADARSPIAAAHLARGAQLEYQAMGRIASSVL